jgi:hypothetical protein
LGRRDSPKIGVALETRESDVGLSPASKTRKRLFVTVGSLARGFRLEAVSKAQIGLFYRKWRVELLGRKGELPVLEFKNLLRPSSVRRMAPRRRVICVSVDKAVGAQESHYETLLRGFGKSVSRAGKIPRLCVDAGLQCGILAVPLEAGLRQYGVRSMYIWDCKLGSILSRQ